MEAIRKPFQGVLNIIRFNWHFYVFSVAMMILTIIAAGYFKELPILYIIPVLSFAVSVTSLLVSFYIYDLSDLYSLNWANSTKAEHLIVNIHAGFDETSLLLGNKYKNAELRIIDFYNPQKHTELSIKRARKAYPVLPQTVWAEAGRLPVEDASADKIFIIFSAHEIRNRAERADFMKELARIIKPGGEIYLTEHLRDTANFIAYNIGFLHFYSKRSWLQLFSQADLKLTQEIKLTPFISTFIISKDDNPF
ncbi:class I SAM-dependent methyltransferase [Chitinophaga tropicalis]|uniref:Methyltransferase domain-containing protein n=1 Tax=Chitinophaga tropicalis TaxID=2683588 RepID=A0A7K1U4L1_9BACT|nr:methyltransferase domain-containing protein [Chitinophaga tropicalis]MVT09292.1 methyltransferase domain-containing protein [Chitinophaga tropicalis]